MSPQAELCGLLQPNRFRRQRRSTIIVGLKLYLLNRSSNHCCQCRFISRSVHGRGAMACQICSRRVCSFAIGHLFKETFEDEDVWRWIREGDAFGLLMLLPDLILYSLTPYKGPVPGPPSRFLFWLFNFEHLLRISNERWSFLPFPLIENVELVCIFRQRAVLESSNISQLLIFFLHKELFWYVRMLHSFVCGKWLCIAPQRNRYREDSLQTILNGHVILSGSYSFKSITLSG